MPFFNHGLGLNDFENKDYIPIANKNLYNKQIELHNKLKDCPIFSSHNTFIPSQDFVSNDITSDVYMMEDIVWFYIELLQEFPVCIELDYCCSLINKSSVSSSSDIESNLSTSTLSSLEAFPDFKDVRNSVFSDISTSSSSGTDKSNKSSFNTIFKSDDRIIIPRRSNRLTVEDEVNNKTSTLKSIFLEDINDFLEVTAGKGNTFTKIYVGHLINIKNFESSFEEITNHAEIINNFKTRRRMPTLLIDNFFEKMPKKSPSKGGGKHNKEYKNYTYNPIKQIKTKKNRNFKSFIKTKKNSNYKKINIKTNYQEGGGKGRARNITRFLKGEKLYGGYSLYYLLKMIIETHRKFMIKNMKENKYLYPLIISMDTTEHGFSSSFDEKNKAYEELWVKLITDYGFDDNDINTKKFNPFYIELDSGALGRVPKNETNDNSILNYNLYSLFNKIIIRDKNKKVKGKINKIRKKIGNIGPDLRYDSLLKAMKIIKSSDKEEIIPPLILNSGDSYKITKAKSSFIFKKDFNRIYPLSTPFSEKDTIKDFYNFIEMTASTKSILPTDITIESVNEINFKNQYESNFLKMKEYGFDIQNLVNFTEKNKEIFYELILLRTQLNNDSLNSKKQLTINKSKLPTVIKLEKDYDEKTKKSINIRLKTCNMVAMNIDRILNQKSKDDINKKQSRYHLAIIRNYFSKYIYGKINNSLFV